MSDGAPPSAQLAQRTSLQAGTEFVVCSASVLGMLAVAYFWLDMRWIAQPVVLAWNWLRALGGQ